MTDREINIKDMFIATIQFDEANSDDYKDLAEAAAQFTIVRQIVAELQNFAAEQLSGASGRAVEQKSVIAAAMRRKMKRFSRTARALNIDDAGLRRLFRIPDENNYQILASAAREFVEEARRFAADFARLGISAAKINDLEQDVEDLETAIGAKASAQLETIGATAGIDEQIERGMDAATKLDAIMHNVYDDDPVKLTQWQSARHVKRAPRSQTETKPPENPPPTE